jgi:hypothetical protein
MNDDAVSDAPERERPEPTADFRADDDACCEPWRVTLPKINGPIVLQSVRAGRDLYDGAPFEFCPWCGASRRKGPGGRDGGIVGRAAPRRED